MDDLSNAKSKFNTVDWVRLAELIKEKNPDVVIIEMKNSDGDTCSAIVYTKRFGVQLDPPEESFYGSCANKPTFSFLYNVKNITIDSDRFIEYESIPNKTKEEFFDNITVGYHEVEKWISDRYKNPIECAWPKPALDIMRSKK